MDTWIQGSGSMKVVCTVNKALIRIPVNSVGCSEWYSPVQSLVKAPSNDCNMIQHCGIQRCWTMLHSVEEGDQTNATLELKIMGPKSTQSP